jgi:Flp pilus assembly pilin Flp
MKALLFRFAVVIITAVTTVGTNVTAKFTAIGTALAP